MPKPRALSLHIGVNSVDPKHYAGWKGELKCCEFDADDMVRIAKAGGMKPKVLHTKNATREKVFAALKEAAKELKAGDLFFLSFSGHSGQVLDVTGDELDLMDETWCLYDAQVIDDEVHAELGKFAKGVRVIVISDSSTGGSVPRPFVPEPDPPPAGQRARLVAPLLAQKVYFQNEKFYDANQRAAKRNMNPDAGPAIIAILGCQHNQAAMEGKDNGVFTDRLLYAWNQGSYEGNYLRFFELVVSRMPSTQTPMWRNYGNAAAFMLQKPFAP
jgi:hypothetical protein